MKTKFPVCGDRAGAPAAITSERITEVFGSTAALVSYYNSFLNSSRDCTTATPDDYLRYSNVSSIVKNYLIAGVKITFP